VFFSGTAYQKSQTVTVTEALVLRPLLDDREHITEWRVHASQKGCPFSCNLNSP